MTDRGVGIARDALETIFDLFEQEGGRAGGRPTASAGLAICRTFVELHGGRISAESAGPGHGATFTVLPIDRIARATRGDVRGPVKSAQTDTTPLRIVIVDDNRDSADTLAVLLQVRHAPRVASTRTTPWRSPATTPRS